MMLPHPNKGVIISFPRSGLNWTRYCIELFSGKRTPGGTKIHRTGEYAVYRTHDVGCTREISSMFCPYFHPQTKEVLHNKVLMIIRNYKECFHRHHPFIMNKPIGKYDVFFNNLKAFDEFPADTEYDRVGGKKKLLVYYEDLVKDFGEMEKILKLFQIDYDLSNFDLEEHRQKSLNIYDAHHKQSGGASTKDDVTDTTWHSRQQPEEQRKKMDATMRWWNKKLFDKYLTRYLEK